MEARTRSLTLAALVAVAASAQAQVPDLLNSLDAGARSIGLGGGLGVSGADTFSGNSNPAGLGYLDGRRFAISYRNLPASRTTLTGDLASPRFDTRGSRGDNEIAHLGYVFPVSEVRAGAPGTLSLSYTVGGFLNDSRSSTTLTSGALNATNYRQEIEAKTTFFTLAYGRANSSGSFSYGLGLTFAQQSLDYSESYELRSGTTLVSTQSTGPLSSTGSGVGVIVGAQWIPAGAQNVSFGLSYRSEINLSGNASTSALLDKIPARLSVGASARRDGLRGGKDFLIYAAQLSHYFESDRSSVFDRDTQTVFGLGVEYNYALGNVTIPIRIGYASVPGAGRGFGSRNAFNYGLGYRPADKNYSVDLAWGTPENSGADFAITINYRFGN